MERQTSLETGQARNGLYLAGGGGGSYVDDGDHHDHDA
jgi:hypothetical protein